MNNVKNKSTPDSTIPSSSPKKKKRPPGRPPKSLRGKHRRSIRSSPNRSSYTPLYSTASEQRLQYERFVSEFFHQFLHITVDDITTAMRSVGDSTPGLSLHPFLIVGFGETRMATVMSWLLWVEAKCTSRRVNSSGWGEWFCAKYNDCQRMSGVGRIPIFSIIKRFRALGVIETRRDGVPAMQHFRIDHSSLYTIVMESALAMEGPLRPAGRGKDALDSVEWSRSVGGVRGG